MESGEKLRILNEIKKLIEEYQNRDLDSILHAYCDLEILKTINQIQMSKEIHDKSGSFDFTNNKNCNNAYINNIYHIHTCENTIKNYDDRIKELNEKMKTFEKIMTSQS